MQPVIAIVGRPNVGKSTLFNRLTHSRDALVADRPGLTRDRQYGVMQHHHHCFSVIDTGGLGETGHDSEFIADQIEAQSMQAVAEADTLLWLVDGRSGLSAGDEHLAQVFRTLNKPVYLLVNKLEGLHSASAVAEFYRLGYEPIWPVSARHGEGIRTLLDDLARGAPDSAPPSAHTDIAISLLGRSNVGKSTLINHILGEKRVLTFDQPGTTRDSIHIPFEKAGRHYTLIDTAGVRRRSKIGDSIEKFSVMQALHAIEQASIILFIIDGLEGPTEQDSRLLGLARDSGRGLLIAVNKSDRLQAAQKRLIQTQLDRKCRFVDYAQIQFISAATGSGVAALFKTVSRIHHSLQKKFSTSEVTTMLYQFTEAHPPPVIKGRRIKLRYAHAGGQNPIRIIIHGNQTEPLPNHYLRYLARAFRQQMHLVGAPVLIECKPREQRRQA